MEEEILALNAAVLSRTPSHTPSQQRDDTAARRPAGDAVHSHRWAGCPRGLQVSGVQWGSLAPTSTFGQCKTRARARGCCSGGAAGWQRRSGGRRAPGAQPASRAQAAAQEQGARLVLSFHPLRSAPKPRHSLIKSSLVVSHRHKAIKMKALMDLSCCEARGAPKPVLGRGEGPRHLLGWPQGTSDATHGPGQGKGPTEVRGRSTTCQGLSTTAGRSLPCALAASTPSPCMHPAQALPRLLQPLCCRTASGLTGTAKPAQSSQDQQQHKPKHFVLLQHHHLLLCSLAGSAHTEPQSLAPEQQPRGCPKPQHAACLLQTSIDHWFIAPALKDSCGLNQPQADRNPIRPSCTSPAGGERGQDAGAHTPAHRSPGNWLSWGKPPDSGPQWPSLCQRGARTALPHPGTGGAAGPEHLPSRRQPQPVVSPGRRLRAGVSSAGKP